MPSCNAAEKSGAADAFPPSQVLRLAASESTSDAAGVLPCRQGPVEIQLGPRCEPGLRDVVSRIAAVLGIESELAESLTISPGALLERLESAQGLGPAQGVAQ